MAHAPLYGELGPQRSFLGGADQTVLRFADHGGSHRIGMAPGDEISDPQHLILFIAQHAADNGSAQLDFGPFQSGHGNEHCGQIAFGIIGSAAVHYASRNFGAEGIILPGRNIPRGNHIGMPLKHQPAAAWTGRPGDNYIRPAGCDRFQLRCKALLLRPLENIIGRRLLAGSGCGIPDGIDADQIRSEVNQFIRINKT